MQAAKKRKRDEGRGREDRTNKKVGGKKGRYKKQTYGKKMPFDPQNGYKGVLNTCSTHQEGQCVKEMFDLLNEYADLLYPEEEKEEVKEEALVSDILAKELATLNEKEKAGERRFYCLNTNVKGVIFIRFVDERIQPVSFVSHILNDLKKTGAKKTRFAVRLVPVEKTCAANIDKVLGIAEDLLRPHFTAANIKTFAVVFKSRHTDQVPRGEVISGIVRAVGMPHKVELGRPDVVILVEVFQKACGVAVVPNGEYHGLQEFNIRKLTEGRAEEEGPKNQKEQGKEEEKKDSDKEDFKETNE